MMATKIRTSRKRLAEGGVVEATNWPGGDALVAHLTDEHGFALSELYESDDENRQAHSFLHHGFLSQQAPHKHTDMQLQEGGVTELDATLHDNEAVIPLDDPEAIGVMAEAIAEGGAGDAPTDAEAAVEIVEAEAEAAVEIATVEAEAAVEIAEAEAEAAVEIAEASADVASEAIDAEEAILDEVDTPAVAEEVAEAIAEIPEPEVVEPSTSHWFFRKRGSDG